MFDICNNHNDNREINSREEWIALTDAENKMETVSIVTKDPLELMIWEEQQLAKEANAMYREPVI